METRLETVRRVGAAGRRPLAVAAVVGMLAVWHADAVGGMVKVWADSRARYVHRIALLDANGDAIRPGDAAAKPYSPRTTCGKCHDYAAIRSGWHFNAGHPGVAPGRRGQPWVFVDKRTGTELPISTRRWPGSYALEDVELTPWQFVQEFGRHLPGGGIGEEHAAEPKDPKAKWKVSGTLEIDCLSCHGAGTAHDQSERARQIEYQNFAWVPVAASGLAVVTGSVTSLPADYDPAKPRKTAPAAAYAAGRFDAKDAVYVDVTSRPSPDRCYFCHTNRPVGEHSPKAWEEDADVHLAAGLTCVDCHRNGLDHAIARGYEGEVPEGVTSTKATLSCQGCHLGATTGAAAPEARGGRLGAPRPRHVGLPATHLEKLSCTACHSGPWPGMTPRRVQTARAHGLGLEVHESRDDEPPHVVEPVYVAEDHGKITPHRMMWPAFWGRVKGGKVAVMAPDAIAKAAKSTFRGRRTSRPHTLVPLTPEDIAKALGEMAADKDTEGEAVYAAGGKLYRLGSDGTLSAAEDPAAQPYSWPLAHDVRPATQSLGSGGCGDCHAPDAPFLYGQVTGASRAKVGPGATKPMYEFQGLEPAIVEVLARTIRFRPGVFWVGLGAAALLGLLLLYYGLPGLARLLANGKRRHV